MFKGRAQATEAHDFLNKHGVHPSQVRHFCGIPVSSLALGTYLGNMDEVTDLKVTKACVRALELGCNFFDTAINYRGQRAERSIGEAIRRAILSGTVRREDVFVSTKAGFVPFDGEPVGSLKALFHEEYVEKGIARDSDLIAGAHCMEPAYLENQIERSRKNLGLETIDLFYIHNPETQLEEIPDRIFYEKLEAAFEVLEKAVVSGKIAAYGMATWSAFREHSNELTSLQLERCHSAAEAAARKLGIETHHFKAIQLPLNLAMPEGALLRTQRLGQNIYSVLDAADTLGLNVAVSAPLFQARLCHGLPDFLLEAFPKDLSQAHCALAFSTAFAGVDSAMVGMKEIEHVEHNLKFLKREPLNENELRAVVNAMMS